MKKILFLLAFSYASFATILFDIISAKELESLGKTHTKEQIIEIAKQRKKDTKDLEKLKKDIELENKIFIEEKQNILTAPADTYTEYCLYDTPLYNSKGVSFTFNICIATKEKLNAHVVKDILLLRLVDRRIEELSIPTGLNLLKDELSHDLNIDTIFITKLSINK